MLSAHPYSRTHTDTQIHIFKRTFNNTTCKWGFVDIQKLGTLSRSREIKGVKTTIKQTNKHKKLTIKVNRQSSTLGWGLSWKSKYSMLICATQLFLCLYAVFGSAHSIAKWLLDRALIYMRWWCRRFLKRCEQYMQGTSTQCSQVLGTRFRMHVAFHHQS